MNYVQHLHRKLISNLNLIKYKFFYFLWFVYIPKMLSIFLYLQTSQIINCDGYFEDKK